MTRDGGPAFPGLAGVAGYGGGYPLIMPDGHIEWMQTAPGMSLRDWFAGQVTIDPDYSKSFMEKTVGRPMPGYSDDPLDYLRFCADFEAILRGIKADAMLAEREKAGGAS